MWSCVRRRWLSIRSLTASGGGHESVLTSREGRRALVVIALRWVTKAMMSVDVLTIKTILKMHGENALNDGMVEWKELR